MAKRTQNIQHAPMTKRQRARHEQERLKQRRLLTIVGAIVVLAVLLIGFGILLDKVIVPGGTVAKVGTSEISNGQYQTYRQISQAQRAYTTAAQYEQYVQFQGAEQLTAQIQADIAGLKEKHAPLDYAILDQMIERQILFDQAANNNVNVSNDDALRELAIEFQPDTPIIPTIVPTTTNTLTGTNPLTNTVAVSPTATPVPELSTLNAGLDTELQKYYDALKLFFEDGQNNQFGMAKIPFSYAQFKQYAVDGKRETLIRTKLGEALVTEDQASKEVYADADQIFVQVTVPPTETMEFSQTAWLKGQEKIQQAAQEIKSGKSFTDVQAQLSDYKPDPSGKSASGLRPITEYAQFSITEPISTQPIGSIGEPYRSEIGWHLIWVKARELRPSTTDLNQKRTDAVTNWLTTKRTELGVQRMPEPTPTPEPPTLEPAPTIEAPPVETTPIVPTPTP